ncbi:MAG: hypothetical protein IJ060_00770 [Oscillospiraceae bacterium]|nr:hypothetical protein [Oscillospiraceae bacterium]
MDWHYKRIRKNTWNTVFRKGWRAWLMLVLIGFLFSYIGASNGAQSSFIENADRLLGADDAMLPSNIELLKRYIADSVLVRKVPFITSDFAMGIIDRCSRRATWIIRILALNYSYYKRNLGEVVAVLVLSAIISILLRLFVQNVVIIGRNRYAMENRMQKSVLFRRIFSPFHLRTFPNTVRVMLIYHISLLLWSLTLVGGIYKYYQYYAVPYLLAENPRITWKEAKALSVKMTTGCKRKIFLTQLSFWYLWLLKTIPLTGLLLAIPLEMQRDAELYFALRERVEPENALLTEPAFSRPAYVEQPDAEAPVYVLPDAEIRGAGRPRAHLCYSPIELIFLFFAFGITGWIWECGLYIVRDHLLVNRGTLYGPWIPIYGVGGTAMVLLLDRFKQKKLHVFIFGVALCAVLEYASSFILEYFFNSSYWDYNSDSFNLNGRIYLAGLVAFGLGGMAAIYLVAPIISEIAARYSMRTKVIAASVLCVLFLLDLIFCALFGFNSGSGVGGSIPEEASCETLLTFYL